MSGELVNFLVGCGTHLVENLAILTAGGTAAGSSVDRLKTRQVSETWVAPTLKPYHTQVLADYGTLYFNYLERCLYVGNINLPEGGTALMRIRKDTLHAGCADEWLRPEFKTDGGGDALIAAVNATGNPSQLNGDPTWKWTTGAAADSTFVTPANPALAMSFRVKMRKPINPPKPGASLQAIQVSYSAVSAVAPGSCNISLQLWQNGVSMGLSNSELSFPTSEETTAGVWVIELKFDASSLADPTGANVEIGVSVTAPVASNAVKFGSFRWLSTTTKRITKCGVDAGSLLENTNATGIQANLAQADVFSTDTTPTGVAPTSNASAMTIRVGLGNPPSMEPTTGYQRIVVRFRPTGTAGTPTFTATLYVNGSPKAVSATGTSSGALVDHWLTLTFSKSDVDPLNLFTPLANIEVRIVTTPNAGDNIKIMSVDLLNSNIVDPYTYDSGWINAFYPPGAPGMWGSVDFGTIGKRVRRSIAHVYFDSSSGQKVVMDLSTRYTRVEFFFSSSYPLQFTDHGVTYSWMEAGRLEEGTALSAMNMVGGFELDAFELSVSEQTDGGVSFEDEELTGKIIRIKLTGIEKNAAIRDIYDAITRRIGTARDVLIIVFPEDDTFRTIAHVWGMMSKPGKAAHLYGTNFGFDFETKERL